MTIRENLKKVAVVRYIEHEKARKKLRRIERKLTDDEYREVVDRACTEIMELNRQGRL